MNPDKHQSKSQLNLRLLSENEKISKESFISENIFKKRSQEDQEIRQEINYSSFNLSPQKGGERGEMNFQKQEVNGVGLAFSQEYQFSEEDKSDSNKLLAKVQEQVQNNSDSENEHEKYQKKKLQEEIKQENNKMKAEKKIFIGSGFTFDMTDFFKFKKKQELSSRDQISMFQQISGSSVAWIILLYTVSSSAVVPGWIMNIPATKFVRIAWRFVMQALIVIPFVLYQKRTISQDLKKQYKLSYIFDPTNIKKLYVSSLSTCTWFLCILTIFDWTYVSHGLVLGGLSNFFLSINRATKGKSHELETGGQVLVILGILLLFKDTVSLDINDVPEEYLTTGNHLTYHRTWWERLAADIGAIATSFIIAEYSKYTSDIRSYYPPFLSMLVINIFNVFHMALITYFFNGGNFDFDAYWGFFSLFTEDHFTSFMYMAIILAFGQTISVFLMSRMFPDPIIPALAMCFQPYIGSFIVQLANVQYLPGQYSMMGYIFIFPGSFIILVGNCLYQRQKNYQEESDQNMNKLLQEIKQLRALQDGRKNRKKDRLKRQISINRSQPLQKVAALK